VHRCSDQLAKTLLIIFNLAFLACGIAIVVVALTRTHPASFDQLVKGLKDVNYMFVAVGAFISLMSFLGCCGAWQESKCMLNIFLVLLVVILIVEVSVGAVGYAKRNKIEDAIKEGGIEVLKKNDAAAKDTFNKIQEEFKCCGINGAQDYINNKISPIPSTCCAGKPETCVQEAAYKDGCYIAVSQELKNNLAIVANVAFGIGFVEVIGIIFACCLRSAINERY